MDEFEKVFENLDVKTESLTSAMDTVMATSADSSEVDALLGQIKEEQGMDVGVGLQGAGVGSIKA